jgi:hypothetical protein
MVNQQDHRFDSNIECSKSVTKYDIVQYFNLNKFHSYWKLNCSTIDNEKLLIEIKNTRNKTWELQSFLLMIYVKIDAFSFQ